MGLRRNLAWAALLACGGLAQAVAQPGIYTCVDAKGRRLTSDRPIAECLDREQKELSRSGGVRRTLKPSLSAEEAALEEEKARKAAEESHRAAEEKRRERLLLARYPDRPAHDRERAQALSAVENVIAAAHKRIGELETQRAKLVLETEFYKADPSRMPARLKRQIEENEEHIAGQKRFIANQEDEKRRVNARFDAELARLNQLWAPPRRATAEAAAPAKP